MELPSGILLLRAWWFVIIIVLVIVFVLVLVLVIVIVIVLDIVIVIVIVIAENNVPWGTPYATPLTIESYRIHPMVVVVVVRYRCRYRPRDRSRYRYNSGQLLRSGTGHSPRPLLTPHEEVLALRCLHPASPPSSLHRGASLDMPASKKLLVINGACGASSSSTRGARPRGVEPDAVQPPRHSLLNPETALATRTPSAVPDAQSPKEESPVVRCLCHPAGLTSTGHLGAPGTPPC